MRHIAEQIVAVLNATPGAADVSIDLEPPLPQMVVEVDRSAAARYGINVSDISDLIETGIGGQAVGQVFIEDRHYDITVRFPAGTRENPDAIGNLVLTAPSGAQIPLSQVAKIRLQTGESTIAHEMNHRHLTVKFDCEGRDLSSFLAEAQRNVAEKVNYDAAKYRLQWGGQYENMRRAQSRLAIILALVLGLMLVLLYSEFSLMRQASLILGIVPFATLGGLVALHVTGSTFNLASSVGFIALFGVAVQNGIIMVANLNRFKNQDRSLKEAVLEGACERLRPVLMTATVATVGMLPAALASGIGSDVQRSIATVIVGGLLVITPLTLFILPTLYFAIEGRAIRGTVASTGQASVLVSVMLLALLCFSGCAVGPAFTRPEAPQVAGYTSTPLAAETASAAVSGGNAQRFVQGLDIPAQWWAVFHSVALDRLVRRALASNPDLQAAKAALRVAQENAAAQRGAYYPNAGINLSPQRQRGSGDEAALFNLNTAQVSVSYIADVFGAVRRETESLDAQADFERFQLEAAYVTLTANVINAAIEEASLRKQIAATREIIKIDSELLELLRRQQALGQISKIDVAAQEAALAQVQQSISPLEKELSRQRNLLTALAGEFPSNEPPETFELAALQLPEELPLSLPSKLVEQRPDVRAAEENLHAANAQIGVAVANRLPNITLSASGGWAADAVEALATPENKVWSVAADLTQPIFEGGALRHRERAARAAYDQAAAQYRGTVIGAFQNVADTLQALQHDAAGLRAAVTAQNASALVLDITQKQLHFGQVNYLALLNAEQTYQAAQVSLVQAQASRFADTVALFQALGGGWWNRANA